MLILRRMCLLLPAIIWSCLSFAQNTFPWPASGNIGIGTASPVYQLDLNTTVPDGGMRLVNNSSGYVLLHANSYGQSYYNTITQQGDAGIIYADYGQTSPSTSFGFVIAPWSNATSGIRLDKNGNVGIGTANVGSNKLAVEGTIGARKVVVTQVSPFADYVFEKTYHLPSL